MTDPLSHGGKVVLQRSSSDDDARVVYVAELSTVSGTCRGEATVGLTDGVVAFAAWSPADPPAWLVTFARAFLRSAWLARLRFAVPGERAATPEPWPHRITRWRAEK